MSFHRCGIHLHNDDVLNLYDLWEAPTAIISDGGYGIAGFEGDPPTYEGLPDWYRPHIEKWTELSTPATTLWFWNTEIGWATVHPLLDELGWDYRNCHIWDKGIGHIAGNSNGKTLRKFPVTTEVCVQYVRRALFEVDGKQMTMQEWLRYEWLRTGLPLYKTNEACGVKNAATRKYFTADHLWYYPPPENFEQFVRFANEHGDPAGRPYFSVDGKRPITKNEWAKYRAKFNFANGITNVWQEPAVRGTERIKTRHKCVHLNQKPLKLLERCIEASTDQNDVVWEPFGGLCSAALASYTLRRRCYAAEMVREYYEIAVERIENHEPVMTTRSAA